MTSLENKVAVVTGGGTGIGRASAEALLADGAKVVVTGRREEPLKQFAAQHPEQISYLRADVARSGDAKKVIDSVIERHGRLDVLVNNAGIGFMKPLAETSDDEIGHLLSVNVAGLLAFSREALGALGKTGGSIINISSTIATAVMPAMVAYGGTKAAVEHITRLLAAEVGPQGIRVNAVAPGATETDMTRGAMSGEMRDAITSQTPLGRFGQPADIGSVVAWLAGPGAAWVTGQCVAASGGLML
ncbi:MAG: SDR family oxidoreductase [Proteobacteria bacterium]|nr:SDR family oxidoreductase [Pseudomonadota bacterium]